jgi:hypothetical protein
MADLENIIQQSESIKDKKLKLFGLRVSGASIMGLFALLSTLVGSLYGGFLLYQKVESLAQLDLGSISSAMEQTSSDLVRVGEDISAIKVELKKDMSDLRSGQWSLESKVDGKLQSIDTRLTAFETKLDGKLQSVDTKLISYDTKLDRFELKVESTKTALENRIQQSLDNPLAY